MALEYKLLIFCQCSMSVCFMVPQQFPDPFDSNWNCLRTICAHFFVSVLLPLVTFIVMATLDAL